MGLLFGIQSLFRFQRACTDIPDPAHSGTRYHDVAHVRADDERLWMKLASELGQRAEANFRVVLVGFNPDVAKEMRRQLRELGARVVGSCISTKLLEDIDALATVFDHLVVNLDAFDDMECALDVLIPARCHNDRLVVVLVSARVGADDFGAERSVACDTTLRAPVSAGRLKLALDSGRANNWRKHAGAARRDEA